MPSDRHESPAFAVGMLPRRSKKNARGEFCLAKIALEITFESKGSTDELLRLIRSLGVGNSAVSCHGHNYYRHLGIADGMCIARVRACWYSK